MAVNLTLKKNKTKKIEQAIVIVPHLKGNGSQNASNDALTVVTDISMAVNLTF